MAEFEFDFTDLPDADFQEGGPTPVSPGGYRATPISIDDTPETLQRSNAIVVDFRIDAPLASSPEDQNGRIHREFISQSAAAKGRMVKFLLALGYTKEQLQDDKVVIDLQESLGTQLEIEIVSHKYESNKDGSEKVKSQIAFAGFRRVREAAANTDADPYAGL